MEGVLFLLSGIAIIHFDEHTRYQFTRMLFAYGTGMTGQNPFANDENFVGGWLEIGAR